jgi:hypothetical protein
MNTKFLILLTAAAATLGWRATAQTNNTTDVGVQTNANESRTGLVTNTIGNVQDVGVQTNANESRTGPATNTIGNVQDVGVQTNTNASGTGPVTNTIGNVQDAGVQTNANESRTGPVTNKIGHVQDVGVQTNANESRTGPVTNKIGNVQDIRVVNGQVYDVATSKKWVSITIPAGSRLLNAQTIQFTGAIQPKQVNLAYPHSKTDGKWPVVEISHFPYDPKFFTRTTNNGTVTSVPLIMRVFPLSFPTTNRTALGEMRFTPACPIFDFGLACTNRVSDAQKTETQP